MHCEKECLIKTLKSAIFDLTETRSLLRKCILHIQIQAAKLASRLFIGQTEQLHHSLTNELSE